MEILIHKEASKIWKELANGEVFYTKKFELELKKKLLNIFQVGDFYYYIFNVKDVYFSFISNEIKKVLGYDVSEITVEKFLSLIHPDDQIYFLNFENKVAEFFAQLNLVQIPNYKVRYDYRIRKKDGEYIRILQQVITIEYSKQGAIMKTLGVHTDISHIKMHGVPMLSFIGLDGEPSYINVDVNKIFQIPTEIISQREKEILSLLINGKKSQEIAQALFISKETVSTHRKNILKKTKANNTVELIRLAIKNGWV